MAEAEAQAQVEAEEQVEASAETEEEEHINARVRMGKLSYQLALLEDAMSDIKAFHEDKLQNSKTIKRHEAAHVRGASPTYLKSGQVNKQDGIVAYNAVKWKAAYEDIGEALDKAVEEAILMEEDPYSARWEWIRENLNDIMKALLDYGLLTGDAKNMTSSYEKAGGPWSSELKSVSHAACEILPATEAKTFTMDRWMIGLPATHITRHTEVVYCKQVGEAVPKEWKRNGNDHYCDRTTR